MLMSTELQTKLSAKCSRTEKMQMLELTAILSEVRHGAGWLAGCEMPSIPNCFGSLGPGGELPCSPAPTLLGEARQKKLRVQVYV